MLDGVIYAQPIVVQQQPWQGAVPIMGAPPGATAGPMVMGVPVPHPGGGPGMTTLHATVGGGQSGAA